MKRNGMGYRAVAVQRGRGWVGVQGGYSISCRLAQPPYPLATIYERENRQAAL